MARYCESCGFPVRPHDRNCDKCHGRVQADEEATAAQARWQALPDSTRKEMEAEHQKRWKEWADRIDLFERKTVWKHSIAGAVAFGVAGFPGGITALAYALLGALAGRILNRRKGGIFLGTVVGAGVFVAVLIVRTMMVAVLRIDPEAFLFSVASTYYADRISGLLCPAVGGLIGYLIESEFETIS